MYIRANFRRENALPQNLRARMETEWELLSYDDVWNKHEEFWELELLIEICDDSDINELFRYLLVAANLRTDSAIPNTYRFYWDILEVVDGGLYTNYEAELED